MKHKKPLIEVKEFTNYTLVEDATGKGPLVVEGVFQRSDTLNENGRIYPRTIWESIFSEQSPIVESIRSRGFFGELDHPDDGRTLLSRTSHIVTEAVLKEDGTVWGRAEILPTPAGKTLEALFRSKCRVGISSRGSGETASSSKGEIVQEDFQLEAWDFVYNPSTPGAYPTPRLSESKQKGDNSEMPAIDKYKELEAAADEVLSANLKESAPAVRQIVMKQAFETAKNLSVLAESEPEVRALAAGTIAELQSFRRKGLKEFNDVTPGIMDRLLNAAKTASVPTPEIAVGDEDKVDDAPIKTEEKMKKDEAKKPASPKRFSALISEMEAAAVDADETEDEKDKVAAVEAKAAEAVLLKAVKKIREDEMPAFIKDKVDGEKTEEDEEDGFDVPAPPDDAMKTEEEVADDAEEKFGEPDGDEVHAECRMESIQLVRAAAKLIRENKILRYRLEVRTKVAAASLAQMAEATKYYKKSSSKPTSIVVRGEKIGMKEAAEVIEELVKKVKEAKKGKIDESVDKTDKTVEKTNDKHGELPVRTKGSVDLREGQFGKNGGKSAPVSSGDKKLDEALALGRKVAAKIASQTTGTPAAR